MSIGTRLSISVWLIALGLAACDSGGSQEPAASPELPTSAGAAPAADAAALLAALGLAPDADGRIENECGERVAPRFAPAELGGAVGTARLVAIDGGPHAPTCYGDGPDLHLLRHDGAAWREIYAARGRMLIVLPTATGGVRDLADGGPGFSFPVWTWDGSAYAPAGRSVADAELGDARFLP
ncbi:MAG TPA: hypothetical protein VFT98_22400 [Myxococcota bacterium]|nr:hypothetical protein [Myxococcota bacterium]